MDRFFVLDKDAGINLDAGTVSIVGDDVKHITKVLRYRVGDKIEVSDGDGNEYICEIEEMEKDCILCRILEKVDIKRESDLFITVYQGLPKSTKMEIILQKLTECGVSEIVLVNTKRSVVNIDSKKSDKKLDRWERIVYEAAKQSKRSKIPRLRGILSFSEAVEEMKSMDISLSPYESEESNGIKEVLRSEYVKNIMKSEDGTKKVGIFIGPEGGFEPEENDILKESGAFSVRLGPRIFRTETAGIVASSILMYEYGDIGDNINIIKKEDSI